MRSVRPIRHRRRERDEHLVSGGKPKSVHRKNNSKFSTFRECNIQEFPAIFPGFPTLEDRENAFNRVGSHTVADIFAFVGVEARANLDILND